MLTVSRRTARRSAPAGAGLDLVIGERAPPRQWSLDPGREGSRGERDGQCRRTEGERDGSEQTSLRFFACDVGELDFLGVVAFAV
jgi:hypothetical protein